MFSPRQVELGDRRIVVPEPAKVSIVGAGFKDSTLTLLLVECAAVVRDAKSEPAKVAERELDTSVKREQLREDVFERWLLSVLELKEPARKIAATRALRAVSKAIANAPIQALADVASAPTDVEVVVRALQQPDAIETLQADDPLGPARLRGLRERERLLTLEGGTLPVDEVARHLKITRQAVNKRRQQGTLVGLDAGRHGYRYPAWQFVREGTIPDLEAVLAALEKHDAWMQHIFMVSPNTRLNDRTPLEELREGRLDDVLKAARTLGEHGAA